MWPKLSGRRVEWVKVTAWPWVFGCIGSGALERVCGEMAFMELMVLVEVGLQFEKVCGLEVVHSCQKDPN